MDKNKIYLVQSDTTVGFSSLNNEKLAEVKNRDINQKTLMVIDCFKKLKSQTRIPSKYKKIVRKSKFTTFIYPNQRSFRVVLQDMEHFNFVEKFNAIFSTSANETKKSFSYQYAYNKSDVIVFQKDDFIETNGSKIFKFSNFQIKKIR